MLNCEICGQPKKDDLFMMVTDEPVCSICKLNFIGGLPTIQKRVKQARLTLGLDDGEYLSQDNHKEAARILGRKY